MNKVELGRRDGGCAGLRSICSLPSPPLMFFQYLILSHPTIHHLASSSSCHFEPVAIVFPAVYFFSKMRRLDVPSPSGIFLHVKPVFASSDYHVFYAGDKTDAGESGCSECSLSSSLMASLVWIGFQVASKARWAGFLLAVSSHSFLSSSAFVWLSSFMGDPQTSFNHSY